MRSPVVPSPSARTGFVLTEPARRGVRNEDAALLDGPVAVLADGAGVPARFRAGCEHSVAWYSRALVDALAERLADPARGLRDALAAAIGAVREMHAGTCSLVDGGPSATVVALRARGDLLEHLVLCDSSLLLTDRGGRVRRITDARVDAVVAEERGRGADAVEARRNAPGGFWVARHEEVVAAEAIVGATPLADVACASLVSDGVTRAVDLLGLCDDAGLAARCRAEGSARELVGRIRREETRRADADRPVARKAHDDATIITQAPFTRV